MKCPLAVVEWVDIEHCGGWTNIDDCGLDGQLETNYSSGWMLEETEEHLTLLSTTSKKNSLQQIYIPRGCVTKISIIPGHEINVSTSEEE